MVEQVLLRKYTLFFLHFCLSFSVPPHCCLYTSSLSLYAVYAVTAEGSMLHAPFVGYAGT